MNLPRLAIAAAVFSFFAASFAAALPAQERGRNSSRRAEFEKRYREAVKKYDRNKDGRLDSEERDAMRAAYAERIKEARADAAEKARQAQEAKAAAEKKRKEAQARPGSSRGRGEGDRRKQELMKRYDRNRDGKLSDNERRALYEDMRERFEKMREEWRDRRRDDDEDDDNDDDDDDNDDNDDRPSRRRAPSRPDSDQLSHAAKTAINRTMRGDENDDGKLNADEFPERTAKPFGFYDTNHDGYITREELIIGLKKNMAASRARRR